MATKKLSAKQVQKLMYSELTGYVVEAFEPLLGEVIEREPSGIQELMAAAPDEMKMGLLRFEEVMNARVAAALRAGVVMALGTTGAIA
jgi:hypothetical protein